MTESSDETEYKLDNEVFMRYRQKRLQELTSTVAEIASEKELMEKTQGLTMIVHFYKPEFRRCKVMDRALGVVSRDMPSILFYRVNVEICPFVTEKLRITVLPFLGFFKEGYFVDQLVGFEDVGDDSVDPALLKNRIRESNVFKPLD
jgi:thioredoxin-like negative regulator of GroEL